MNAPVPFNAPAEPQTFQEACDTLRALESEVSATREAIRKRGIDLIVLRFRQGRVVDRALGMSRKENYGEQIMETLAQRAGIHPRTLYRAHQFYRHPQFAASEARLRRWIEETEEEKGRVSWSYCINWAEKQLPEEEKAAEEVLEKEIKKLEKEAERLEHKAEDLRKEVERWNDDEARDEAAGAIAQAETVAEDLRGQAHQLRLVKPERWESAAHLKHVRSYCCLACGSEQVDAHHIVSGGMGTKADDVFTVPLCREHHAELHAIGPQRFTETHQIDFWKELCYILAERLTGRKLIPS